MITGFLWDEAVVFSSRMFYKVLGESQKFTRGWGLLAGWGEVGGTGAFWTKKQRYWRLSAELEPSDFFFFCCDLTVIPLLRCSFPSTKSTKPWSLHSSLGRLLRVRQCGGKLSSAVRPSAASGVGGMGDLELLL